MAFQTFMWTYGSSAAIHASVFTLVVHADVKLTDPTGVLDVTVRANTVAHPAKFTNPLSSSVDAKRRSAAGSAFTLHFTVFANARSFAVHASALLLSMGTKAGTITFFTS
jgi:hypothetical protein